MIGVFVWLMYTTNSCSKMLLVNGGSVKISKDQSILSVQSMQLKFRVGNLNYLIHFVVEVCSAFKILLIPS